MDEFIYVLTAINGILATLAYFFLKKLYFSKISIVFWLLWLTVSLFSITGVNKPSLEAYLILLIMPVGNLIGALIAIGFKNFETTNVLKSIDANNHLEAKLFWIAKYVLLPIVVFMTIRAIYYFFTLDAIALYREIALGVSDENSSDLYFNIYLRQIYQRIISPLCFLVFFVGFADFLISRGARLLTVGLILFVMNAIISFGRFNIYFASVLIFIINFVTPYKFKSRVLVALQYVALIFVAGVLFLTNLRSDSDLFSSLYSLVISTHTIGFALFSNEYMNNSSLLHQGATFGIATLSDLLYWPIFILRRIGVDVVTVASSIGQQLHEFQNVGADSLTGSPILANAYVTTIYPPYMDGGVLAVILFSLLFGYLFAKYEIDSARKMSIYHKAIMLDFFYLSFYGLFMPSVTSNSFTVIAMIFLIANLRNIK